MRKIFAFIFSVLIITAFSMPCFAKPSVSAKAAVVICADSGEIVYSENADVKMPMASTTKIMSSLVALQNGADDTPFVVTDEMVRVEGTSMGLKAGDTVSALSLVKGMLICSGNDAANATAYAVSGGIEPFVCLMNDTAKQIGMTNTHFVTPSGLDADAHYSTAYDMALLGAEAIKNREFLNICSAKSVIAYYGNPAYRRVLTNHNKLLSMSENIIGIKTGFTKKSGRCLVSAMQKDGKTLVAVTLSAPDDWNDHLKLYDYVMPIAKSDLLSCGTEEFSMCIVGGKENSVSVVPAENVTYTFLNRELKYYSEIYIKQFEYAPVYKGETVGRVDFFRDDGTLIKSVDLTVQNDVLSAKE